MSAMPNVRFGVSVWKALLAIVVLPPAFFAVAVTVYFVAGLRAPVDVHWTWPLSNAPATCPPSARTATSRSVPLAALTTIGWSGRLSAAPLAGVIETVAGEDDGPP